MCSDELIDFRTKLPKRVHSVLFAKHVSTGKDMAELARDVLVAWAESELHAATVMARVLREQGVVGEQPGSRGDSRRHGGE